MRSLARESMSVICGIGFPTAFPGSVHGGLNAGIAERLNPWVGGRQATECLQGFHPSWMSYPSGNRVDRRTGALEPLHPRGRQSPTLGPGDTAAKYRAVSRSEIRGPRPRNETMMRKEEKPTEAVSTLSGVEIEHQQGLLGSLLDSIPDIVFYKDLHGVYLGCNPAFAGRVGRSKEEIIGKTDHDLFGEEEADALKENDRLMLEMMAPCRNEEWISYPDGRRVLVDTLRTPYWGSDGKLIGVLGISRDITQRKRVEEELARYRDGLEKLVEERTTQLAGMNDRLTREIEERRKAEQRLQESQQMLQLILDTIPVRVFWKDLDSRYLGCNRPFALDAGLPSPEAMLGRDDFEMGWAEQAELYRSDDRLVMSTGKPKLGYEEPQTLPDGSRIWLRTNKVPLLDTEGNIRGVLGTYEDVTESKRMEEKLRASETKYRIVADNTYDWEYWKSPEGRFLYTSPSCLRITGYTAGEFEEDPQLMSRIVHPDDRDEFDAHMSQDQGTSEPFGLEYRIVRRDGTIRWIGHICQPVFDAHGLFLGRRGSNRDITDRKQAEKAMEESARKLKLFAYSVAHDLKSPAVGVYGLSNRLYKTYGDVLDEKGRYYCEQILRTSEHIAALVDKVNVYISTKESRPCFEEVDMGEIIRVIRDEFSSRLSVRGIQWEEPETAIRVRADRLSMLRVFRNFLDNSLKYGGDGLSRIWTGYEETEGFHVLSFGDDGMGLQKVDFERIFQAFQRDESSRGVEGTGLGLTIVKEIAEQHGGRVWVKPDTGKGTTFYLSISKDL